MCWSINDVFRDKQVEILRNSAQLRLSQRYFCLRLWTRKDKRIGRIKDAAPEKWGEGDNDFFLSKKR